MLSPDDFRPLLTLKKFDPRGSDEELAVAYHEAGHALIDHLYGFGINNVTIIADTKECYAGAHTPNDNGVKSYNIDFYSDIAVNMPGDFFEIYDSMADKHFVSMLLAGFVAQAFYTGEHDFNGASSDLNTSAYFLNNLGYDYLTNEIYQPYYDNSVKLLEENIELLHKIASDLYAAKTLTSEYFENLKPN